MTSRVSKWLSRSFDSSLFQYKELRGMFFTLLMDQLFIVLISILSSAMVSSIGEAAIAAVNMVGIINTMMFLVISAISVGGSIIVARAKGRGDELLIRNAIGSMTSLSFFFSLLFGMLLYLFADGFVNILYPVAEPLLKSYSVQYMRLLAISLVPFSVFNSIFNAFRGLGDTHSSLILTIIINGIHLVCSFLLINMFDLGVLGAGYSLIIARIIGMVVAVLLMFFIRNSYRLRFRDLFLMHFSAIRTIVKLGIPLALESLLFNGGMLIVQVYLAYLTTSDIAAHGIATSALNLYLVVGNALTALASTVCGQCYGARQYDLVNVYCRNFCKVGSFLFLLIVVLMIPILPFVLSLYHPTEQALPIIYTCLIIVSISLPLMWSDGFIIPMALRSVGDVAYSTFISVIALMLGRIVLGYIFTIVLGLGVPGVWMGMSLEWLFRAVFMKKRFKSSRWMLELA